MFIHKDHPLVNQILNYKTMLTFDDKINKVYEHHSS